MTYKRRNREFESKIAARRDELAQKPTPREPEALTFFQSFLVRLRNLLS